MSPAHRLRQLLSLLVQCVHHLTHTLYGFQHAFIGLVHGRLFENNQYSLTLIQNAAELFVQDHLGQFLFHLRHGQLNALGNMGDLPIGKKQILVRANKPRRYNPSHLHTRVGFNDAAQVLLQHGVV